MSPEQLELAQQRLGYRFTSTEVLSRAFTHASTADSRHESNERLEFLGDAVLGLICCEMVYQSFPEYLEGEMTKVKSTVVSRQTCAALAKQVQIDDLLKIGKGMQGQRSLPPSLSAATLEAVIAAIYLDGGLEAARSFLTPLLAPLIRKAANSGHQENFKSVLQQHAQQRFNCSPLYHVLDEQGPDHAKCFEVCVEIAGRRFSSTWGASKKQAEQVAALSALQELGVVEREESGDLRVVSEHGRNGTMPAS